jgi:hypothetical protein
VFDLARKSRDELRAGKHIAPAGEARCRPTRPLPGLHPTLSPSPCPSRGRERHLQRMAGDVVIASHAMDADEAVAPPRQRRRAAAGRYRAASAAGAVP